MLKPFLTAVFILGSLLTFSAPSIGSKNKAWKIPKNFLWGAATSAHQVEGGNTGNDWYEWEKTGHTQALSGQACDHYHRYKEDLDLVKALNLGAFRLSIEWSRIEPSQDQFSETEIAHYKDVLMEARKRGLKTFVTLHHFTNPQWAAKQGGWMNPAMPIWFETFTKKIVSEMGELVDFWITVNEPNVNALTSYIAGATPPGLKDPTKMAPVLTGFLKAHALAYHAIHARFPNAMVGFAHHMRIFAPARWWSIGDQLLARWVSKFWNLQILEAMKTGKIHLHIPFVLDYRENYPPLAHSLDFIGVNYYTREYMQLALSTPEKMKIVPPPKDVPKTDQGWEIYPEGFYKLLVKAGRYHLPIYVTENGIADANDSKRKQFICQHLHAMARAMEKGADVRGYLYWSLLDNFEWVDGFIPRFGLVEVDYNSQKRTARDSAFELSHWIDSSVVPECSTL